MISRRTFLPAIRSSKRVSRFAPISDRNEYYTREIAKDTKARDSGDMFRIVRSWYTASYMDIRETHIPGVVGRKTTTLETDRCRVLVTPRVEREPIILCVQVEYFVLDTKSKRERVREELGEGKRCMRYRYMLHTSYMHWYVCYYVYYVHITCAYT